MRTPGEAFEYGRSQAVSPTRFCGDLISMPGNAALHRPWIQGFIQYSGTFKEVGEAYMRYLNS